MWSSCESYSKHVKVMSTAICNMHARYAISSSDQRPKKPMQIILVAINLYHVLLKVTIKRFKVKSDQHDIMILPWDLHFHNFLSILFSGLIWNSDNVFKADENISGREKMKIEKLISSGRKNENTNIIICLPWNL